MARLFRDYEAARARGFVVDQCGIWKEPLPDPASYDLIVPQGSAEAAYDDDTITDQSMRTLAAEIIREKLLGQTHEEIPYALAVDIDEFVDVFTAYCERVTR